MKRVIFSIDDDAANRYLIEKMLEKDYTIHSYENAVDVIKNIRLYKPDVILLDIMMPQIDGFECLINIKKCEDLVDIPVIMITAKVDYDSVKKSIELGAYDYIKKPVINYELISKVRNAIIYKDSVDKVKVCNNVQTSLLDAKRIIDSILPDKDTKYNVFKNKCEILSIPKDIVSGDFYSYDKMSNKRYLFLGDCVGHGIPGSMLSIVIMTIIKSMINIFYKDTNEILRSIADNLSDIMSNKDSYNIYDSLDGVIVMIEDIDNIHKVQFSSAIIDMIIITNKEEIILNNDNIINPLMQFEGKYLYKISGNCDQIDKNYRANSFDIHNMTLHDGDRIFLWTDGIYEQIGIDDNSKIKKYTKKKFLEFLIKNQNNDIQKLTNLIYDEIMSWKSTMIQIDDITFVAIEL